MFRYERVSTEQRGLPHIDLHGDIVKEENEAAEAVNCSLLSIKEEVESDSFFAKAASHDKASSLLITLDKADEEVYSPKTVCLAAA
jgi:hypothetical protein